MRTRVQRADRVLTILDVAREAKVSIATVSRALSVDPACASRTRERVLEVAKRMGYRRNPAGAILASTGKAQHGAGTPAVALIAMPAPGRQGSDNLPAELLLFPEAARSLGYAAETVCIRSLSELGPALDRVYARGCSCLVLWLITREPYWRQPIDWRRFSIVSITLEREDTPFHNVRRRRFGDMVRALEELRGRGYRRIGVTLLRHGYEEATDLEWLGAVRSFQYLRLRGSARIFVLSRGEFPPPEFPDWLRQHRPDAVISFNPAAWGSISDTGLRPPRDIGFLTLHHAGIEVAQEPGEHRIVSGFAEDLRATLTVAVRHAEQLFRHSVFGIQERREVLEIPATWIEGSTLSPRDG